VPHVVANDIRFHVQRVGRGEPTVVLLHGMLVDNLSSLYLTLAPAVAKAGMEAVLYDMRGHGRSERPRSGYTVDQAVADLWAVLDALEVERPVHLLGNSFGALVALEAALARPERVDGLVLIEAQVALEGWGEHIAHDLELAGFGLAEDDIRVWLDDFGGRKLNRLARSVEALITETSIIDDLAAARPLQPDALRALETPALAIYGAHSDAIERAHDLAALMPRLELHVLADCAHSVLFEATRTVRGLVVDWFERVRAGEAIVPRTHQVAVGEHEGEGAEHQEHVDYYRAELERRMGAAVGATALRVAPVRGPDPTAARSAID
jgi:pimeloyl-ACP methyl ester carboxylesterase